MLYFYQCVFGRYFRILPWSAIAKFPSSGYFAFPLPVYENTYFPTALSTKYVGTLGFLPSDRWGMYFSSVFISISLINEVENLFKDHLHFFFCGLSFAYSLIVGPFFFNVFSSFFYIRELILCCLYKLQVVYLSLFFGGVFFAICKF